MPGAQPVAVVFAAAPVAPTERLRARLRTLVKPYIVAADRGAATALAFGYQPDVVIGDLDSIDAATLAELDRLGVSLEVHPRAKNATDGQLAVRRALQIHPTHLLLLGFLGGRRLDQALANVHLLVGLELPAVLLDERNECVLVRPRATHTWRTEPHEVVSLVPLSEDVGGVRTDGLRWPLRGEALHLGDTRGVSNEPNGDSASVSVEQGLLIVTRHFPEPELRIPQV
ncbi:MAG: thiamine diphosphokinase [Chloroflexi bacterium]|nr:thiamine diphosphokinase [Chloroflexota bacterium]